MMRDMKPVALMVVLASAAVLILAACGSRSFESEVRSADARAESYPSAPPPAPAPAPAPAMAAAANPAAPAPTAAPAATAEPRPPAAPAPAPASKQTASGGYGVPGPPGSPGSDASGVQLASQRRIIIRTVDMTVVVADVAATLDEITAMAKRLGGWVVSSDRSLTHRGSISIRVPSDDLDAAILELRGMAEEVESEVSSSQDVTDEYVDLQSRLTNQQATEGALIKLLDRANSVEAALEVQRELTRVQEEIERIKGRVKFLEQTSAFSLVNVTLRLSPMEMRVDAGADQTVSIRDYARFRATFEPPEGMEDFTFTWNFGDGSEPVRSSRTAPTADEGKRVTATVTHAYRDVKDSPYIVQIEMEGSGESGIAEGEDTLIVETTELPVIEVFAGESMVAEQGDEVAFSGSFTRPEGLTEVNYKWDFGDGSAPDTGSVPEGATRVDAVHVYQDYRPFPYQPTLTITAKSEAGEVEAVSALSVLITERPAWTVAGWDAGNTGRTAVRSLSAVGVALQAAAIWVGIFSPVWIVALGAAFLVRRWLRGRRSTRRATE